MRILTVLLLAVGACGDDLAPDAANLQPDADLAPYYQPCSAATPAACPEPYMCTPVLPSHDPDAGVQDVCLIPCDSASDCPAPCCCRGVECGADTGKDGFCVCV